MKIFGVQTFLSSFPFLHPDPHQLLDSTVLFTTNFIKSIETKAIEKTIATMLSGHIPINKTPLGPGLAVNKTTTGWIDLLDVNFRVVRNLARGPYLVL